MIDERIKELVDFAKSESPYRSANKGWLTENIFLQWGSVKSQDKSSDEFDQFVKASVFWQPIIQMITVIFFVIFLATMFAFAPVALSKGGFNQMKDIFEFKPIPIKVEQKVINEEVGASQSIAIKKKTVDEGSISSKSETIEQRKEMPSTKDTNSANKQTIENNSSTKRKLITATDLFQPNHS
ncbi:MULTISPECIES: hypothetical protein [unclassified Prochlorococcus]|uniref:hypothetical protein n=1 Tax=unclassified Prochlorococcus TaxID=2627481 RepID=UPI000533B80D|nr:hypothetical protein [Prochlorococcus sp. MIT 0602]KGG16177.1 hypothetical protein EV07_1343 [Prochlorococcus sp. MIT 0603]KGG18088.1 hypothetical protein EV06_0217 [Prochlorococcus sp. MIT 0602]